ncbi:MAG TPA: GntR family transcriptional regulator, partial [Dysgonomonas sp.]|nr:GntR family transcriptional regulator [Dysgonomonas sp.]
MEFKTNKPIYQQIVDFCFRKILTGEWMEDERIPSVRELGMLLQVNPNTVMTANE